MAECLERQGATERAHLSVVAPGLPQWLLGAGGLASAEQGNAEGEEEDAAITGEEEEDDVMALPSIKVDNKWLKPVDRRQRDRRRERGELTRKARPTPKVASSGRVTNEVRKLRPTAKKCPFLRKETPRLEERGVPARAREPPPEGHGASGSGRKAPAKELAPDEHVASGSVKKAAPRVASGGASTGQGVESRDQDAGPILPPLTLSEAVDTWVLMLGLAGADDLDARPGTILPAYTTNSITETLWSYGAADRVTLVLAFQQLLQRMMVVVGSTIEAAIQTEENSRDGMVEVEVDEEGLLQLPEVVTYQEAMDVEQETVNFMMTKGIRYRECLGNLQAALAAQSPRARRANVRWLMRRLHHRDTDIVRGYLLGHARNRAGDLLALLTATLAEVEDAGEIPPGDTWCLEWWQQVEVYLPIGPFSMAAKGFPVPLGDPTPMLFMRPLPDESPTDDCEGEGQGPMEVANAAGAGQDRDPDWDVHLDQLLEDEREAVEDQDRRRREEEWQADQDMKALRQEEEAMEAYKTMAARDWDDWAMWDAMYPPAVPRGRKRQMVVVELASGSDRSPRVARQLRIPVEGGEVTTLALTVNVEEGCELDEAPTTPAESGSMAPGGEAVLEHGSEGGGSGRPHRGGCW